MKMRVDEYNPERLDRLTLAEIKAVEERLDREIEEQSRDAVWRTLMRVFESVGHEVEQSKKVKKQLASQRKLEEAQVAQSRQEKVKVNGKVVDISFFIVAAVSGVAIVYSGYHWFLNIGTFAAWVMLLLWGAACAGAAVGLGYDDVTENPLETFYQSEDEPLDKLNPAGYVVTFLAVVWIAFFTNVMVNVSFEGGLAGVFAVLFGLGFAAVGAVILVILGFLIRYVFRKGD